MKDVILYTAAVNPPRRVQRAKRPRGKWIAKFLCESWAQVMRLERFYKEDQIRLKASRVRPPK